VNGLHPFNGVIAMMAGSYQTAPEIDAEETNTMTASQVTTSTAGIGRPHLSENVAAIHMASLVGTIIATGDSAAVVALGFGGTAGTDLFYGYYATEERSARTERVEYWWQVAATEGFKSGARKGLPELLDSVGSRVTIQTVLLNAQRAAKAGNIRLAYREVFRLLDQLFLDGRWDTVGAVLRALCSKQYPITVGLGAVRFSSSAAQRISGWKSLIQILRKRATDEGMDADVALRGLA
jgi:hypothetical protein